MSTTATRVGASWAVVEQASFYDILRGTTTVTVYEGDVIGINELLGSLQYYERLELSNGDAPKLRLTVYAPDLAEAPVFELLANQKERDMYEHEVWDAVTDDDVRGIVQAIKKPENGAPDVSSLGLELYSYIFHGYKKFFDWDYVLRYQLSVSNAATLSFTYGNTGRTLTKAQMLASVPGGVPAGIQTAIDSIPNKTAPTGFAFGWLKTPPVTRQTQLGRVVIDQQWWLNIWPTRIFPTV